jgi:hypothetical protein
VPSRDMPVDPGHPERAPRRWEYLVACLVCLVPRLMLVWFQGHDLVLTTNHVYFASGQLVSTKLHDPASPTFFPLLVEALWLAGGKTTIGYVAWMLALQALLGGALLWMGRLLHLSRSTSWVAVIGAALFPPFLQFLRGQWQLAVTATLFTAVAGVYLAALRRRFEPRWSMACAAACFVFFVDRPNSIVLIAGGYVAALAWGWLTRRRAPEPSWRPFVLRVGTSLAAFVVLLLGLAATNQARFGNFSPFTCFAGQNVYFGNNPWTVAYINDPDAYSPELIVEQQGWPDSYLDRDLCRADASIRRTGLAYLAAHPGDALAALPGKTARYFGGPALLRGLRHVGPHAWLYHALILVGLGWLVRERRWVALLLLLGTVVLYWLPHVFLSPVLRYRWTTEPALLLLAAFGITATAARLRRAATTRRAVSPPPTDEPAA